MKKHESFLSSMLLSGLLLAATPAIILGAVCSEGTGEPPFLAYGVDSNLLMLIDNSGSMLDTAYVDEDTDGILAGDRETQCFDDNYVSLDLTTDPMTLYAGTFPVYTEDTSTTPVTREELWYKWVEELTLWKPTVTYTAGDRVYENGVVYEALSVDGASNGNNIYEDENVEWVPITRPVWQPGKYYRPGSFIYSTEDGKLYRTESGGTSSAAATASFLSEDLNITWTVVPTWAAGTVYGSPGTYYVVWDDVLYEADVIAGSTTAGTSPWKDTGVTWIETNPFEWSPTTVVSGTKTSTIYAAGDIVTYNAMIFEAKIGHTADPAALTIWDDNFAANWQRIDRGYYQALTATQADDYCNTVLAVVGGTKTKYTSDGLCLVHDTTAGQPERIVAFAASGNFLNWLTASKFDIQKSILTGGKFDANAERLISENRGCSGSRFIKQVTLNTGSFLTLSVRGPRDGGDPQKKDLVDQSDDTTRIEVLAISATGYDVSSCQDAIDKILSHGLNGAQSEIDACLAGTGSTADARSALNHAMQYCWQTNNTRNLNTIVKDCENVYAGLRPDKIANFSNAYNCYGIFDDNLVHDVDRVGYAGRCYDLGAGAGGGASTCDPYPRDTADCNWNTTDPCIWQPGGAGNPIYRNSSGIAYTEICTDLNKDGDACKNNTKWETWYTVTNAAVGDGLTAGDTCDPTDAVFTSGAASADWSSDIDGVPTATPPDAADTALLPATLPFNNNTGLTDEAAYCFYEGMEDYCSDLLVPEVIDPTDQETSTSGDYGNIPALLVDSGVLNKLGVDVPMNVMTGHIYQDTQPEGLLHETASELRIGAMAFNSVGASTECLAANTTDLIEEYCPATNRDGARVISPIRLGSQSTGTQTHVDDLVEAINEVRATSWTPLAEAVYNAIGYYTQNTLLRLNPSDFQTDSDVTAGWQDGQYYARGSYILDGGTLYIADTDGISSGTSLATDVKVQWSAVAAYQGAWANLTTYSAGDIVSYDGKLYFTGSGGISALKTDAAALGKDGPLFDAGIRWEFLVDPVVNHCQENFILVISEGASTADINADVETFALGTHPFNAVAIVDTGEAGADDPVATQCSDGLKGSSYVDDLLFFAHDENDQYDVYPSTNDTLPEEDYPFADQPKNNITTYIVTAGKPRDDGNANECNPSFVMEKAAANGGTGAALQGENPYQLEQKLLEVFNELRQRASAGSAASVISSARGGEGAIYQAIFWPELVNGSTKVTWAGDVHGLFLDENGYMYEDTNGDRKLVPTEDLDKDGKLDCGEDLNCNLAFDAGETDVDGDGLLDRTEDLDGDGVFDAGEDIDGDGHFDQFNEDSDLDGILDGGDQRVIIFFDSTPGVQRSRVCWNTSIHDSLGTTCTRSGELEEVHFLWSANQWLSEYPVVPAAPNDLNVRINRADTAAGFIAAGNRQRYIFTWNDDDGNGIVDTGEVEDFVANADGGRDWSTLAAEFSLSTGDEVDQLIRWIRGEDFLVDEDLDNDGIIDTNVDTDGDLIPDLATEDLNGNGVLETAMRSRQSELYDPDNLASSYGITWRLGDIIHSTPMTVASPAEGFHIIYNDFSYAQFVQRWGNRRNMVYFGGNDGMLHAVNAGFYNTSENKFYLGYDYSARTHNDTGPDLGTEMWAYVPYNLHPHLQCLSDVFYTHKYFVDLRPRIMDVQIFEPESACSDINKGPTHEECIHPNGWGTILIGGMRFGGSPTIVGSDQFISSYFILDITNPEAPPELLGEVTSTTNPADDIVELGYTTAIPTAVVLKHKDNTGTVTTNKWYLIFGSGPSGSVDPTDTDYPLQGKSDQGATISVVPMEWLVDTTASPGKTALRIPAKPPGSIGGLVDSGDPEAGSFPLPNSPLQSFVSDPVTVDFDINPSFEEYKSDAVYFGTVEGEIDPVTSNNGFSTYLDGTTYWNGGGQMYRLVMSPSGHIVGKSGGVAPTLPEAWEVRTLLNLGSELDGSGNIVPQVTGHPIQPITASAAIGTDAYNFWIYFGTGRFFDAQDKTDRQQQSYYGIKEPMEIVDDVVSGTTYKRRKLTWEEVELSGVTGTAPGNDPGSKGVVKVDEILVQESSSIATAALTCRDNTDIVNGAPVGDLNCLTTTGGANGPTGMPAGGMNFYNSTDNNAYLDKLERYIAGTGFCASNDCTPLKTCTGADYGDSDYKNNCTDGWRKDFWPYNNREKNVGQATLLGGLVTFTTYQPNSGQCQAEGSAYLYGVYYKTGTSWFENVFGVYGIGSSGQVENKLNLGRGLATTPNLHVGSGGEGGPKAFVQTSTGEIKEIQQENLPLSGYESGRTLWREFNP